MLGVVFDVGDTLLDESRGWYEGDPILPGVRESLPSLARAYKLGILSNTLKTAREEMAIHLERFGIGDHFQVIVTSSDLGWRKPHPLAFEAIVSALGVPAESIAMVGNDLEADIAGAKAFGMRTVHFRWSPRYRGSPGSEEERPSLTIVAFAELPAALKRLAALPPPPRTSFVEEGSLFTDEEIKEEKGNHAV